MKLTRSTIRFRQMVMSPLNVRQTPEDDPRIPGLADSICELGLLQDPVVHKLKGGKHGALDGGRRYRAMSLLLKRGAPFNFDEVPVIIAEGTDAELVQLSATANFQREQMSDVELFHAVKTVTERNPQATDEMLAQGFGVTVTRMRRILRLAHIHPDILETYAQDRLTANSLQAYAATADLELQKQVFDSLTGWQRNDPSTIRRALGIGDDETREMMQVVGMESYVAAGGAFEADLFSEGSGRVLHPEVLGRLYNEHVAELERALRAQYPDRELTFGDPPRDRFGTDYRLQARAVPTVPPHVQQRTGEVCETIEMLEGELSDAVDWDRCEEEAVDVDVESAETAWDTVPLLAGSAERVAEIVAELAPLRTERQELELQATASPPSLPAAATHVHLKLQSGRLVTTFWYPDAKAAGFSDRPGGATAKRAAASAADPATPVLTGRADVWLRAARVKMAITHILGGGSASAETRARAHMALIYAMARRLVTAPRLTRSNLGLVESFAGATYNFGGSGLEAPQAELLDALSSVPGLMEGDPAAGFLAFERSVTQEQLDLCAAVVFALKIEGTLERKGSIVDEVMTDLALPAFARRAWTPTREFFDLFRKATIQAWIAIAEHAYPFGDLKVGELKAAGVEFFAAGPAAAARFGLTPEAVEAVRAWLPPWLRWASAADLAAKRGGTVAPVPAADPAAAREDQAPDVEQKPVESFGGEPEGEALVTPPEEPWREGIAASEEGWRSPDDEEDAETGAALAGHAGAGA